MNNPITVLLLEDDTKACRDFEEFIKTKPNFTLIGQTSSSIEAFKIAKTKNPTAIIVDLELHDGIGSGIDFLKDLHTLKSKSIIIVTTNIKSDRIYNQLHSKYADFIFFKKQYDYSVELVLNTIEFIGSGNMENYVIKNNEDKNELISNKINSELDKIGISYHLKGRTYLYEAIFYLLTEGTNSNDFSIFQYLAKQYKASVGSIGRTIQTAINTAWRNSSIEDLSRLYTAQVNYHTGVPTPTEFIYFYTNKIAKFF